MASDDALGAEVSDAGISAGALDEYFGDGLAVLRLFVELLGTEGERRGLIGPRESGRLWVRHIGNCAAVVPFLPPRGTIGDVGSGAGLPGVVVAVMLPMAHVILVEPMERRCAWLRECTAELGLRNVEIRRARAEDLRGLVEWDAVTARAVAPLTRLMRICLPLVRVGGALIALKGRSVSAEVASAQREAKRLGGVIAVLTGRALPGTEQARIVQVRRVE